MEAGFENALFLSRWLMAPIYVGLVVALAAIVVVFVRQAASEMSRLMVMTGQDAILMALSLIDLSLVGNLLLIVIFSGYENFVSKMDNTDHHDRPEWMGAMDFSGVKMRLIASVIAISAISLLKEFIQLTEGELPVDHTLVWLLAIQGTFVGSGVLMALMDRLQVFGRKNR
jgi:uncharacterized protein (TIGR00645 family)